MLPVMYPLPSGRRIHKSGISASRIPSVTGIDWSGRTGEDIGKGCPIDTGEALRVRSWRLD